MQANFRLPSWGVLVHMEQYCNVVTWLNYATTFSTQYALVLFTFDRLLATVKPFWYRGIRENMKV